MGKHKIYCHLFVLAFLFARVKIHNYCFLTRQQEIEFDIISPSFFPHLILRVLCKSLQFHFVTKRYTTINLKARLRIFLQTHTHRHKRCMCCIYTHDDDDDDDDIVPYEVLLLYATTVTRYIFHTRLTWRINGRYWCSFHTHGIILIVSRVADGYEIAEPHNILWRNTFHFSKLSLYFLVYTREWEKYMHFLWHCRFFVFLQIPHFHLHTQAKQAFYLEILTGSDQEYTYCTRKISVKCVNEFSIWRI